MHATIATLVDGVTNPYMQDVMTFVCEMVIAEKDLDQQIRLLELQLSDAEWGRVRTLLALLGKSEKAQQSFSSDSGPAVHLALPALEALHMAWDSRTTKPEYSDFWPALEAGVNKINYYYDRMSINELYTIAMCKYNARCPIDSY